MKTIVNGTLDCRTFTAYEIWMAGEDQMYLAFRTSDKEDAQNFFERSKKQLTGSIWMDEVITIRHYN